MKINFKRLDHIQLCIPIGMEKEARNFYTNVLRLTEIPKPAQLKPNGGLWFQIANIQLHLGTEDITIRSKSHPAFEIEDLLSVRSYLEENNIPTQNEIQVNGQIRFSFRDPFGNRIEFLEYEN